MDIVVRGRHCEVPERFRRHAQDKLVKVEKLDPKVMRIDVEVSKEHNPRLADTSERVELTLRSRGPVIRAEAAANDPYAALDLAWGKLETRLRRARDRRRVHHGGKTPVSVAAATAIVPGTADAVPALPATGPTAGPTGARTADPSADPTADPTGVPTAGPTAHPAATADSADPELSAGAAGFTRVDEDGAGPMLIREKVHRAEPMSLDQALYEMELVGHDFFLFVDAGTGHPSVVYRRHAYSYGVIRLAI